MTTIEDFKEMTKDQKKRFVSEKAQGIAVKLVGGILVTATVAYASGKIVSALNGPKVYDVRIVSEDQ